MKYPTRTCKCGHEHECSRLDPIENGKLRHALAREIGRVPPEKREGLRKAMRALDAEPESIVVSEAPMVEAGVSMAAKKRIRPSDMCPHGREYKWCSLDICKAEVA